jgi:hypothetical protein
MRRLPQATALLQSNLLTEAYNRLAVENRTAAPETGLPECITQKVLLFIVKLTISTNLTTGLSWFC